MVVWWHLAWARGDETATRWVKPPWVLRLGRVGPPRAPSEAAHSTTPPCRHVASLTL